MTGCMDHMPISGLATTNQFIILVFAACRRLCHWKEKTNVMHLMLSVVKSGQLNQMKAHHIALIVRHTRGTVLPFLVFCVFGSWCLVSSLCLPIYKHTYPSQSTL